MATVYMPTNQLREGEATIEQQLGGRLLTIPHMIYLQEADVSPAPPLLANSPTPFQQGKRSGTGYYCPRYPHGYHQHGFNYKYGTSMESNEERAAVLEEDEIMDAAQEVSAYEAKRRHCGNRAVAIPKAVSEVQAAREDQTVYLEEALATPEGVEIEKEAKLVAIPEEEKIGKDTAPIAKPEEETIFQEAKAPTTPKKDNSRLQKRRNKDEKVSPRAATGAATSIVAGEIKAHKEEDVSKRIEAAVDAPKDHNILNDVEAGACPQEKIVNLIDARTRNKKQKGKLRQRMTHTSLTVCLGEPRAVVASKQGKTIEEETSAASKEEQLVNGAEITVGSLDKTWSENQENVATKTDAITEPKFKKVVNQSKSDIGLKKGKSRLRQREKKRKTENALKKGVPAAAGETQKAQDLRMKSIWKYLKQVPSFIKKSIDKIFLKVASVSVHIFGYNRTPKRILRLRAEQAKKGVVTP